MCRSLPLRRRCKRLRQRSPPTRRRWSWTTRRETARDRLGKASRASRGNDCFWFDRSCALRWDALRCGHGNIKEVSQSPATTKEQESGSKIGEGAPADVEPATAPDLPVFGCRDRRLRFRNSAGLVEILCTLGSTRIHRYGICALDQLRRAAVCRHDEGAGVRK
jgi:hypothetical protein